MKVIVTGGLGFIGSNLSLELHKRGFTVAVVDSVSDYYSVDLKLSRRKYLLSDFSAEQFHLFDLTDLVSFNNLLAEFQPEVVIHLAGQPGVRLPVQDTFKYVDANLVGFSNVLQGVIEKKVPYFLYASSSSVYGNSKKLPYSESEDGLEPISFYGATKLCNEILAKSLSRGSSTRIRGMRFFTVYGPWGRPDMAYFRLAASAMSGYEFQRYGDGSVKRDFTFIDDVISSIFGLIGNLQTQGPGFSDVVNLGGGRPHSLNDLVNEFEILASNRISLVEAPESRGDVEVTAADSTYLESLIGLTSFVSLSEGVKIFYEWASQPEINSRLNEWIGE